MKLLKSSFIRYLLLAFTCIFPLFNSYAAPKCKNPISLAEVVAKADLIATATILRRHLSANPLTLISKGTKVYVDSLEVEVQDILKRPYVQGYDFKRSQIVKISPQRFKQNARNKVVLFLRYRGKNSWQAFACGVLPLDAAGNIYKACNAIRDLFSYDRFLHERKCLLATPAIVSEAEFAKEIERGKIHARRYEGAAEVLQVYRWESVQAFQRVLLRFRGRTIKKLLPDKFRGSQITVMGYYPTELLDERSYKQTFRKGRKLKIKATWFEGNLVLDEAKL